MAGHIPSKQEAALTVLPFHFPVLGFYVVPGERIHGEHPLGFRNPKEFETLGKWAWDIDSIVGTILIDNACASWTVTGICKHRKLRDFPKSLWKRMNWLICSQEIIFDMKFHQMPDILLDEVKYRVCNSISKNREYWYNEDVISGEFGPPISTEQFYSDLLTGVQNSDSIAEIIEHLSLEGPPK